MLVIYGQYFSVLKLACFYYGVLLPNAAYLLIDAVTVSSLTGAMALSLPRPRLAPRRPPSSLLGANTVSSVLCVQACNSLFLVLNLKLMGTDEGYVRWPAELTASADWWTLADNWEVTTLFTSVYLPFLAAAAFSSFGGAFPLPLHWNRALVATLVALAALASVL